jgi:hypothetical protein
MERNDVFDSEYPGELEVLPIIPFGYPAQPVGKGKKQCKSISEVAHLGQPFE